MTGDKNLERFMKANIPFRDLKRVGFFAQDVKANDYVAQAERICHHFGLKNIYDYAKIGAGVRYHLTDGGVSSLTFAQTISSNRFGDQILKSL